MRKFCFICGKKTDKLVDGRCEDCYSNHITLIKVPKEITIDQCSKCGLLKVKSKWKRIKVENILLDKIKLIEKGVKIEIKEKRVTKKDSIYEIIAINKKEEKHEIKVKINKTVCYICARKHTQYYEGILQIRGSYNDKILDFIEDRLIVISRKDKKAFYSFHDIRGGIDIRIGSKSAISQIAEKLKRKYDCELKRSYKLVGKRKGKEVYRNVISVRFS